MKPWNQCSNPHVELKLFLRFTLLTNIYTFFTKCFVLFQVPEAFVGSLVQDCQPQFLTNITIQVTKLTQPQEFVVSERLFLNETCTFGMLTTKRVPWVSTWLLIFHALSGNRILWSNFQSSVALWLVQKACTFLSANQLQTKTNHQFGCFYFQFPQFSLVPKGPPLQHIALLPHTL